MRHRIQPIRWILIITWLVFGTSGSRPAAAQTASSIPDLHINGKQAAIETWSEPVNISRSGSASQPRIVAASDGRLQAFWIDQFDGLMMSIYNGTSWSTPVRMPLSTFVEFSVPGAVTEVPYLVSDSLGRIHAFWYGFADPSTGERPLYYNVAPFGQITWSTPFLVALSAPVFSLAISNTGGLYLAFLRTIHSTLASAGIYFVKTVGSGPAWTQPVAISTSIYYRAVPLDKARLDLIDAGGVGVDEILYLAWDDPRVQQTYSSYSSNSGQSWSGPILFSETEARTANPSLVVLPQDQGILRMWQATNLATCTLQQQLIPKSQGNITVQKLDAPSGEIAKWILNGINECPTEQDFLLTSDKQGMLWIWNQGTPRLDMAIWQPSRGDWKQQDSLGFNFLDTEVRRTVILEDLHATLSTDRLAVIGTNKDLGEVWVTIGPPIEIESSVSTGQPVWSNAQHIPSGEGETFDPSLYGPPAIGMNQQGQVFVVWAQPSENAAPAILYSRYEATQPPETSLQQITNPVEIFGGITGALNRQPALLVENSVDPNADSLLHIAWSSGQAGEIRYSRANGQQAGSSSGWIPAITISEKSLSSATAWPQIAMDGMGRMYVAYVLPLNEGRGVYLAHSDDGGNTWTKPGLVFDAAEDNWQMVDHLSLVVTPTGEVHIAWVHQSLPDRGGALGIYYTSSSDRGETWSEAIQVTEAGSDWPRLALTNGQIHLLYAKTDDNSAWHRWQANVNQASMDAAWSTPTNLPGWKDVSLPYGVSASGRPQFIEGASAALYAAGVEITRGMLLFSTWNGERWSEAETYQPPTQVWESFSTAPEAEGSTKLNTALSTATRQEGGMLAMSWWEATVDLTLLSTSASDGSSREMSSIPGIAVVSRVIPVMDLPPAPALPTPTQDITPTPEASQMIEPSATPSLNGTQTPVSSPISPLVLGGSLAAIIVLAIFVVIVTQNRRR